MGSTRPASTAGRDAGRRSQAIRIHQVSEARDLERLASEWRRLLERSRCSRAFGSPAWLGAWCRSDGALRPYVWTARRGGRLAAVLPLARTSNGAKAFFPGDFSDANDAVAAAGDVEAAAAVLSAALAGPARWLELSCLRPDSLAVAGAARLGFDVCAVEEGAGPGAEICHYAEISQGYDRYLAGRSASFRYALTRAQRRARQAGLTWGELHPDALEPSELAGEFLRVHRARFPASCFDPPVKRRFLLAAAPGLFSERGLRVFALQDGDRILAMQLHMQGADSLEYWNGGFVARAGRFSPGRLLLAAALEQACREGLAEFDLLRGDEAYKSGWATSSRRLGGLVLATAAGGSGP